MTKPTLQDLNDALVAFFGKVPRIMGSPHEGTPEDAVEIILHEIAHLAILDVDVQEGFGTTQDQISPRLEGLTPYQQDRHEVYAIALELEVVKRLSGDFDVEAIFHSGMRNTRLFDPFSATHQQAFQWCLDRASNTPRLRGLVDDVEALILNLITINGAEAHSQKVL